MNCNDEWLEIEILTGLQKLSCLSLDRTPAAEMLLGTTQAWLEAVTHGLAWDRDRDTTRVRQGFVTLAATMRRWPSPAEFLAALPGFNQAAIGYEVKPVPAEVRAANIAWLRSMLEGAPTPVLPGPETRSEQREAIEADLRRHYDRKTAAAGGDS